MDLKGLFDTPVEVSNFLELPENLRQRWIATFQGSQGDRSERKRAAWHSLEKWRKKGNHWFQASKNDETGPDIARGEFCLTKNGPCFNGFGEAMNFLMSTAVDREGRPCREIVRVGGNRFVASCSHNQNVRKEVKKKMTDEGSDEEEDARIRAVRQLMDADMDTETKVKLLRSALEDDSLAEGEMDAEGEDAMKPNYQRGTRGPKTTRPPSNPKTVYQGAEIPNADINFTPGSKGQNGLINTANGTVNGQAYDLTASKKRFDAAFNQEFLPALKARFRSS